MELTIVMVVLFGAIGATLAADRRRSVPLWLALCAATGIIGVVVLLILGEATEPTSHA